MELATVLHTNIPWGLWIVYVRLPDGRIKFFRGKRYHGKYRKKLFIDDFNCRNGDWVWEQDYARLFTKEPCIADTVFNPLSLKHQLADYVNYRAFDETVLKTHLLM